MLNVMAIAIAISAFSLFVNGMTHEIKRVFYDEASTHFPIFSFGLLETGRIKEMDLETSGNNTVYQLYRGRDELISEFGWNGRYLRRRRSVDIDKAATSILFEPEQSKALYRLFIADGDGDGYPIMITGSIHIIHEYGELTPSDLRAYRYYQFALCLVAMMGITWSLMMKHHKASLDDEVQ